MEHKEDFYKMNVDLMQWHYDELLEKHQVDVISLLNMTAEDIVDNSIDKYYELKPSEGVVMMLLVEETVAGMLALTKLDDETAELHRMWIRPEYRGRGLSKPLLSKVLDEGVKLGLSRCKLSTPKFADAAHHLYGSAGFVEICEYPETEVDPRLRQYWIYMEKKG